MRAAVEAEGVFGAKSNQETTHGANFQPTSYTPAAAPLVARSESTRSTSTSVRSTNDGSHCLRGIQGSLAQLQLLANGSATLDTEHLSKINSQLQECVGILTAATKAKARLQSSSSSAPLGAASSHLVCQN